MYREKIIPLAIGALASTFLVTLAYGDDSTSSVERAVAKSAVSKINEFVGKAFDRVELDVELREHNKPEFSIRTIQPLHESEGLQNTWFWQGSWFHHDGGSRNTVNLGLGYRRLLGNDKWLLGANFFYDHEFPYDHQRASVGAELRSTAFEFNSNYYWGISGWNKGRHKNDEKALGGYDVELGMQLPYMPWAKVYFKEFEWFRASPNYDDLRGQTYSLKVNKFFAGWSVEAGIDSYDGRDDTNFIRISYSLALDQKTRAIEPLVLFDKEVFSLSSMENHRLDRVRRENIIVKQVRFSATVTGV